MQTGCFPTPMAQTGERVAMQDIAWDRYVRDAAMAWLHEMNPAESKLFRREELEGFVVRGVRIPLLDRQRGIRKPIQMSAALSIRTTFTPPGQRPPYDDATGPDGRVRYKYRGLDPRHPDNAALRAAMDDRLPLIWFVGAVVGAYVPIFPVWIVDEEADQHQFVLALDAAQSLIPVGPITDSIQRAYVERQTRARLHQPLFRAQVLHAYDGQCAICRLRYLSLLDAAHILPDGHPRGTPDVPNGLALCKIHHAAFDQNLLGIRPDSMVVVRADIQAAVDGPMLRHGLQAMNGVRLALPVSRTARPDPARLEERYEEFIHAG